MALPVSVVQSCAKYLSERGLRSAIAFEAEGGYQNALGRTMRFNSILISKISKFCHRSKHKSAEKLLEEANNYVGASVSDRSKLLNKVSVLMGYNSLHDLIEFEKTQEQSGLSLEDEVDDPYLSRACEKFPSIILGSSPPVELYNGGAETSREGKWILPYSLPPMWPSFYPSLPSMDIPTVRGEDSFFLSSQPPPQAPEPEENNLPVHVAVGARPENSTSVELILDKAISSLVGISKRHCHQLEDCGFHTLRKLLHHFPRTYADVQNPHFGIDDGQYLIFVGKIMSSKAVKANYSLSFLEVIVAGEVVHYGRSSESEVDDVENVGKKTIYLHLKKFLRGVRFTSQPFLRSIQKKYNEGDVVCVSGKVKSTSTEDHFEMREYSLDVIGDEGDSSVESKGKPYPIYPSKGGLKPQFIKDTIARVLHSLPTDYDPIPKDITGELGLMNLHDAYTGIHQPKNFNEADRARIRFIFDEFFYLQLGRLYQMLEGLGSRIEKEGLLDKYRNPVLHAVHTDEWSSLAKKFLKALPYSLTKSQLSAVSEIMWDLKRPVPMNRLLQGDVGCGKTAVAFLACMEVVGSGYQAAYMVPTELLAIQHYEHLHDLLQSMDKSDCKPSIALLTGSTPMKQARVIRQGLQSGDISLIIGTHSLIAESVDFLSLRLAVIDEQHRFGVIQRGKFNSKLYYTSGRSEIDASTSVDSSKGNMQMAPHVLAMSATPIPRTLALALYGDMSLTQITDLPPGRIPIDTHIIEGNEIGFEKVYQMMLDELETGGKVYLVYPVIEQSEQLPQLRAASSDFETICMKFPGYTCGLLHGKMKSDEKDEALKRFRHGQTQILLSTQVIEIGVDVPDASMMVVMNSERFGIAQLHQLRGRVGRGARKSKCILLASNTGSVNRLKVLELSSDGFHLAKVDLLLRGPGDLLGKKQSGHLPEFPVARLEIDGNILQDAHTAALRILGMSHDLDQFPKLKAELSMRQPLSLLGD